MKLLLHICCAPCAIMPLLDLRNNSADVVGFFYNPNIQPFKEHERRLATLRAFAAANNLPLVTEDYNPLEWFRQVVFNERGRCAICYALRLQKAAQQARAMGLNAFSSTLLYSVYQNREQILAAGRKAGAANQVEFVEYDFRPYWKEGQLKARQQELYLQPYCGCIYSEAERYMKKKLPPSLARGEINVGQPS